MTGIKLKIGDQSPWTMSMSKLELKQLLKGWNHQITYVKGTTIFDAVRTIDDVVSYGFEKYQPIDLQKGFYWVYWNFLRKPLERFNFVSSFIAWIIAFYIDIVSCVMNNGFTTPLFKLSQDDPLFPCLVILVLEILAIDIRNDSIIKGIRIDDQELKLIICLLITYWPL